MGDKTLKAIKYTWFTINVAMFLFPFVLVLGYIFLGLDYSQDLQDRAGVAFYLSMFMFLGSMALSDK